MTKVFIRSFVIDGFINALKRERSIKHNQVELEWSSNHPEIQSEKTIRWFLFETQHEQGKFTIVDKTITSQIISSLRPATPYVFVLEEEINGLNISANRTVTTRKPDLEIQTTYRGWTSASVTWNRKEYTEGLCLLIY